MRHRVAQRPPDYAATLEMCWLRQELLNEED